MMSAIKKTMTNTYQCVHVLNNGTFSFSSINIYLLRSKLEDNNPIARPIINPICNRLMKIPIINPNKIEKTNARFPRTLFGATDITKTFYNSKQ
jgi:hypothetical protein